MININKLNTLTGFSAARKYFTIELMAGIVFMMVVTIVSINYIVNMEGVFFNYVTLKELKSNGLYSEVNLHIYKILLEKLFYMIAVGFLSGVPFCVAYAVVDGRENPEITRASLYYLFFTRITSGLLVTSNALFFYEFGLTPFEAGLDYLSSYVLIFLSILFVLVLAQQFLRKKIKDIYIALLSEWGINLIMIAMLFCFYFGLVS